MARKLIPLPVPFDIPAEADCPRCPKKGAPAWMATFADIATLLMAFFVLILSFAEFNSPKFKMVAGSLEQAFGVQRQVPVMEQPKGTTILELNFSPSPEMSVTEEMTQDTTETQAPELKQPTADDFDGYSAADAEAAAQALTDALQDVADIVAQARGSDIVVAFAENGETPLSEQFAALASALGQAAAETGEPATDVMLDGLGSRISELAVAAQLHEQLAEAQRAAGLVERSAAMAEEELSVALQQEVAQGLVTIEQREDRVIVTVGAAGAFPSGTADLTPQARDVMARIAFSAMGDASDIVVTGHTDTVPLSPGSPYRDNWGLAAARASAVVRELSASALIDPERLTAISRGETSPISDNATADGRAENRRIEIEIMY